MDNRFDNINTQGFCFAFSSFVPTEKNPCPDNRIKDFLVCGPFVLQTDGTAEEEHMYAREKILLEDYLACEGGEKHALPEAGKKIKNMYYGKDFFLWEKGLYKWDCLRFDKADEACDEALYASEQRNAVYYAAFYIDCEKDEKALICYENSGSALFVNGEQVDFKPYGRVKGLPSLGFQCLISLHKGKNLIMFKLRPGYIADTIDISMSSCLILPLYCCNEVYVSTALASRAYFSRDEKALQLFPAFVYAEKTASAEIICGEQKISLPEIPAGLAQTIRFEVPVEEDGLKRVEIEIISGGAKSRFELFFPLTSYEGFSGTEHIFSDFHFDTSYHQEQRAYALGAFHITKSILELLEENPEFRAILSEIDYLHPFYCLYPRFRKTLTQAFKTGAAEADCFYNQPNELTSSGEAFIRNLVYGRLYHRDVMGKMSSVYAPGDVFGHCSQLSQLCKKGGCNYIKWGKKMLGVDCLFNHVSPDGSYLLHDKNFGRKQALRLGVHACSADSKALSYVEPYPREKDSSWMKNTLNGAEFSLFSSLGEQLLRDSENNESIDFTSRDITQHHSGTLLTRTELKQANRLCENLLIMAEKFSAIAAVYGATYPEKALDKAWRQLLCAQHHDSVTGTNNEISFIDLIGQYRECAYLAKSALDGAARFICSGMQIQDRENSVVVFNSLSFSRGGLCEFALPPSFKAKNAVLYAERKEYPVLIKNGRGFFLPARIPATGCLSFRLLPSKNKFEMQLCDECTIENSYFKVTVDNRLGGGIVSLFDLKNKKELFDFSAKSPMNTINVLKEEPQRLEAQHELYTNGQKLSSHEYVAQVSREKCPLWQKLKIKVPLGTIAMAYQEITLYKNADYIEFTTLIEDYISQDDLFTVSFPFDIKGAQVIFDDRLAAHVSSRSKKYMSFQTHQYASFSGCRILPANQWFGIGPTVTVFTGLRGSFNVGMCSLIRKSSLTETALPLLFALTKKGVPVTPYSDTLQQGTDKLIHFNEDIYSCDTRFVLSVSGDKNEYGEKLFKSLPTFFRNAFIKALKKDGKAIVYTIDYDNIYKKKTDVIWIEAKSEEKLKELVRQLCHSLEKGRSLHLSDCIIAQYPGDAEDYTATLINNGTPACSVEGEATLNLMLFHTASFYGNQGRVRGGEQLVPEHKSHAFTYRLFPHKGSYREAQVYKCASDFNEPLFCTASPVEKRKELLPERNSFLKINGNFALTALKAGGYPSASMRQPEEIEKRGIALRGFEPDGIENKLHLYFGFPIERLALSDFLEQENQPLESEKTTAQLTLKPHSVDSFIFYPRVREKIGSAVIAPENELIEPVYQRSWEHDMGAQPMGFLKFAATIERKSEPGENGCTVMYINAVNNSAELPCKVKLQLRCAGGVRLEKTSFSVSLAPTESISIPFKAFFEKDSEAELRLLYKYDSQSFTDIYSVGRKSPEMRLETAENKIICHVKNPSSLAFSGELYLLSPFECRGRDIYPATALAEISPFYKKLDLAPFEEKRCEFKLKLLNKDIALSFWAAAKLCSGGKIYFAFTGKNGVRHTLRAEEFYKEIKSCGGSIKNLLQL